ncbi:MAG: efflux RND transporter periplasmic adaptor subunit [Anaerolineales bacterium]|nr:efflux RND transporter periplasmic adaptor subunit [Anaerolineales bacterium]
MQRKFLIIGIIVVLVLVGIGAYVWQSQSARPTTAASIQTTTVRRGSLAASVSAAGNVSAVNQVAVAFQTSGVVARVNVAVGDAVKKDRVLMELDSADLNLALKTAQTNLASAQASYEQTTAELNYALRNARSSQVSSKANLDAAKAQNAQNPNSLLIAKAALEKATVTLQQAQGEYNKIAWRADVGMSSQATTLQQATIDYQSALANYKMTEVTINDTALKQAQTQYDSTQVALEQAQKNLDTTFRTAQAQLDNAKLALEQAQRNLDKAKIVAPFDGVVAAVNYSVGDSAGSSAAVIVVDLAHLQIKVTVAEVDVEKIKIGNPAQVALDALPGKTYTAQVTAISPAGTVTQGVVNYPVILALTDADNAIKPGMTANLTIEVERRDNVLLVPTRAIRTQGNQKVVTVQKDGQSIQTRVGTGLSNDSSIEITSGLNEGDVVVITQTTTRTGNVPGGMGIPGMGGPPP